MRSRPLVAALSAAAAAVSSVALAAPASAAPVPVGCRYVVIDVDAYLPADTTCAGDGITLVGDATLDLRGHTLGGDGSGTGVTVTLGATQAVVDGRLVGWSTAVAPAVPDLPEGEPAVGDFSFTNLDVTGNRTVNDLSIDSLFGGHRATFTWTGSRFEGNGTVFGGLFGGHAVVTDSTFVRNATVVSIDTAGVSMAGSVLEGNDVVVDDLSEAGLTITDSVLVDNRVVDAGGHFMGSTELVGNEISGSDVVVGQAASYVRVVDNRITGNGVAVDLGQGWGEVARNVFEDNRVAFTSTGPTEGFGLTAIIEGNSFARNGDAVVTAGAGTELRDNVAHHNAGWGIYAPGVTDLGGNRAWANGSYPQCVGVVCAGKPRS